MQRRKFIALAGGTALAPHRLNAQTAVERRRHIGVLMGLAETDPATVRGMQAVVKELQTLGWTEAQNIEFIYRSAGGRPEQARVLAKELVGQIFAFGKGDEPFHKIQRCLIHF